MTTIVETYDAPMLDYSSPTDIDVHMQPSTTSGNTEFWFQAEEDINLMQDDPQDQIFLDDDNDKIEVEVDMDNAEYEMTDAEELGDPVDIDVPDLAQSLTDHSTSELSHTHFFTPDNMPLDIDQQITQDSVISEVSDGLIMALHEPDSLSESPISDPVGVTSLAEPAESDSGLISQPAAVLESQEKQNAGPYTDEPDPYHEDVVHGTEAASIETPAYDAPLDAADPLAVEGPVPVEQEVTVFEEPLEVSSTAEPFEPAADTSVVQNDENQSSLVSEDVDAPRDPHEISEGIYIDPPPAVFLSLSSTEDSNICLFNPASQSRPGSPSAGTSQSVERTYTVLLDQLPTLYYEPLSAVFDALRQEDLIAEALDLTSSELILDVYDLHLILSEDNIYARQVTLHDLNVLHDASGLSGPLRLRLQSVTPRFILRYNALREKVSALTLGEDGEGIPLESEADPPQEESFEYTEHEDEAYQEHEDETYQEYEGQQQSEYPFVEDADGGHDHSTDEHHEQHPTGAHPDAGGDFAAPTELDAEETNPPTSEQEYPEDYSNDDDPKDDNENDTQNVGLPVHMASDALGDAPDDVKTPHQLESSPLPREEDKEEITKGGTTGSLDLSDIQKQSINQIDSSAVHSDMDPSTSDAVGFVQREIDSLDSKTDPVDTTLEVPPDACYPGADFDDSSEADAEGELDTFWEDQETLSNESSATLSSKASKRSFHELDHDEDEGSLSRESSPESKRARVD